MRLKNAGVDATINLVYGFYPKGEGSSGEVYFAKYDFAGSSREWSCPTYGAVVFYDREIPPNWPSGVLWNRGNESVQRWKYVYNEIACDPGEKIISEKETANIRNYDFLC